MFRYLLVLYANVYGQIVAYVLNWPWRSIKLLLLHLVGFYITLPTGMSWPTTNVLSNKIRQCLYRLWRFHISRQFTVQCTLHENTACNYKRR